MAPPKKEKISKDEAKRLFEFYQKVELDITQKLNKALLSGDSEDLAYLDGMLSGVRKTLKELRLANKAWCEQAIPHVYTAGLSSADIMVEGLGIAAKAGFGGMHQQVALVLAENTNTRLEDVTKVIGRQAEDIYRHLALEQIRGSVIGYDTWSEVARNYRKQLAENGITGFTDRSGKKWNMSSYAQMVARTSTMEAHLQGTANRLLEQGFDLIKISHHATACKLCTPWEGKILSLTGKTPGFPTLEEAWTAGLFHPNCLHAYGLYIDLDKEIEEAETYVKDKEKTVEKKQTTPPAPVKEPVLTPQQKLDKERGDAIEYLKGIAPRTQKMHIEAIETIVKNQAPEVQEYFYKYIGELSKIVNDSSSGGCYRYFSRQIDLPFGKLEDHPMGPYVVFFHEFGHFLDNALSISSNKTTPHILLSAQDRKFYDLIKQEYYKLLNSRALEAMQAGTPGVRVGLKPEIQRALYHNHSTNGVQDSINGVSVLEGHNIRVRWGHKADYWRSFGDVNKETFASMFASLFNYDMAAAYEKYLPDSYKYFKEKLAADVKRLDRTQSVEEKLKEMEKAKKKMQKTRKKIMSRTSY